MRFINKILMIFEIIFNEEYDLREIYKISNITIGKEELIPASG